jgi:hypothetical protein
MRVRRQLLDVGMQCTPIGRVWPHIDRYGERKTVIGGESDDFRSLSAAGRANGEAPFLALAKVASTIHPFIRQVLAL